VNIHKTILLLFFPFIIVSCAGIQGTQKSQEDTKELTTPKLAIPPNSPLSKIKEGMGMREVADILGQPNDQEGYMTGKAFIPFYFGSDVSRLVHYYKGLGQIYFSGGGAFGGGGRVTEIVYDPTEDGYR
jgi:hypothetical protein